MSASDSMASVISSLCKSFRKIPHSAVPEILDCVLASTGLSPLSVFDSLIKTLPILNEEDEELGSGDCCYTLSLMGALCHLLKKIGPSGESVRLFLSRSFLPGMKMAQKLDREFLNQIAEMFIDVVFETNSWKILETTLVPFLLRAICLSLGVNMNEILDIFQWSNCMVSPITVLEVDEDTLTSLSRSFHLSVSCQVLILILGASRRGDSVTSASQLLPDKSSLSVEIFSGNLLWDLCNIAEHLLLHSSEHRSCTVIFLLPNIFKTFVNHSVFQVSIQGQTHTLSRICLSKRIWKCCRILFSHGPSERRDAYNILSLYISYHSFQSGDVAAEISDRGKSDDIICDKGFWVEIKRGLVDKDALVRKQSLQILKTIFKVSGGNQVGIDKFEKDSQKKHSNHSGMTKRDLWADKEAKSLGLGNICCSGNSTSNFQPQREAFVLLYEMLEEYGTHLVEAAWNHQVSLLLQCSISDENLSNSFFGERHENMRKASGEIFTWLPILWERGFNHDNPLVRCLIMQSFTVIEWRNYGNLAKYLPEAFVCGPFMQALNNPVHHDDFGLRKIYSSRTMKGAADFLHQYTRYLNAGEGVVFLRKLASLVKYQSFSRVGLMSLAECIAVAACGLETYYGNFYEDASFKKIHMNLPSESEFVCDVTNLLESFRFVIESSKQHFNPSYRLQVCEKILDAAVSSVCISDVPLTVVLHFISAIPSEFTKIGGWLRKKIQDWPSAWDKKQRGPYSFSVEKKFLKCLQDLPRNFTSNHNMGESLVTYDDEELTAWASETKMWARVLFLSIKDSSHLEPTIEFIRDIGSNLCNQESDQECLSSKFIILIMSLVHELQMLQETVASSDRKSKVKLEGGLQWEVHEFISTIASDIFEKFTDVFCVIMDELVSFAGMCCSVFWSENQTEETLLPYSIRGRLGGPSQRRLPSSTRSAVLQAIVSLKAVALIYSWCSHFRSSSVLCTALTYLWKFLWRTISSPCYDTQIGAETGLAAYEALAPVLKALVSSFRLSDLDKVEQEMIIVTTNINGAPMFDRLLLSFLQNINSHLAVGVLARTRYAVLLNWKWACLESLLLFPCRLIEKDYEVGDGSIFLSGVVVRSLFNEVVGSLENAGEDSILPMLRSIRLILGLYSSGSLLSGNSSCNELDVQMMWDLVHSSWILHVNCNKRRVAPIAALLSAVLHPFVFANESMHITESDSGPLKWFIEKVLEEGRKSPRTIRLAALHLAGLWLSYPKTLKYYMKELKLFSLYGSVAFDEDFEGEVNGNVDAKSEVSLLAQRPDSDLSEEFINTELYARVTVAVLFHKLACLAEMGEATGQLDFSRDAAEAGKSFLLELLDSVVNDKDLSKELYKKYSSIHRRKIRAWQMICVLSKFSSHDILERVTDSLHVSLCRNNLPAVRQYLETFAINIFLKFPCMVKEQLVPILRNYDMKPQALASYVFIAANVILHSPEVTQARHLDMLLPPIIPLLTSHHHSLRGFTQLLVYHVLCKMHPSPELCITDNVSLEKRCFMDLKLYLEKNSDCMRLRASMEGYLSAYDPCISVTPTGIFINRVEELEFECVPTSLMDRVLSFLNDARDDLRSSMAKDAVAIKNESLKIAEDSTDMGTGSNVESKRLFNRPQDFQKKITPNDKYDHSSTPLFSKIDTYMQLADMEREDQLFDRLVCSRSVAMEKERASRQSCILVASFIDRVPNLAGLARTCEVFKASGLAIADASVLHDKQFQLISVTAEKWVPIIELPVNSVKMFIEKKKWQGFSVLGLEQTANSIPLDQYSFPEKTVLILGHEKEGIPVDIIHILDACIEIPQLGVVRSLNVHVSGAIALWEYTRQQRKQ